MTVQGDLRPKARLCRVALIVVSMGISILLSVANQPAYSLGVAASSDFPSKPTVKAVMDGKGHWRVYPGPFATLGSKPRGCRSDKQMLTYDKARSKFFFGRERGMPRSVFSGAEIVILKYSGANPAREAVKRNASYPQRCPKTTEWVCTDCDGINTTWRTKVPAVQVGRQSVVWKFRQVGNFKSNGYTVVARKGSTVVRMTVSRTRDGFSKNEWVYPRLIKKQVALRLARKALSRAA